LTNPIKLKHLDWDSTFFGKKIGAITILGEDEHLKLDHLLQLAKEEKYDLIYVFNYTSKAIEDVTCSKFEGKLVDTKVTFSKKVESTEHNFSIEQYSEEDNTPSLKELAFHAGKYSRFKNAKYFKEDQFKLLYSEWLNKSISKEIADEVFIYKESNKIVGFVTVKIKNDKGLIGLISVSIDYQKKGIGRELINKVCNYLVEKNVDTLEVATQKENTKAIKFYLGNQLSVETEAEVYHFLLDR